jgi:uncharacterized protein (TIGR02246 family)
VAFFDTKEVGALPATSPDEIHRLYAERFRAGDLDGLMELYEPNAIFLSQSGEVVSGLDAIRELVGGFVQAAEAFDLEHGNALETDGVALLQHGWTLTAAGPDGSAIDMSGRTAGVARRRADGTWRIAIDNPWGVE